MTQNIKYIFRSRREVTEELLNDCARLFAEHYGRWGKCGHNPGAPISLSASHLRKLVDREGGFACLAFESERLLGYAFGMHVPGEHGLTSWVTQLVVDTKYQNKKIASTLLGGVWAFSDNFAWGLVSANPFAIRALEAATRRRCDRALIKERLPTVRSIVSSAADYLADADLIVDNTQCVGNTGFFLDHSNVAAMLKDASATFPWQLGDLNEGEEWLGVTFASQQPRPLSFEEFERLRAAASETVARAFDRMAIGALEGNHVWTKHTQHETNFLTHHLALSAGCRVLDLGCGSGRHSAELAAAGMIVTAVDRSSNWLEAAKRLAKSRSVDINFVLDDIRTLDLGTHFDAVLCLYDVVGSFPDDADNGAIIATLAKHLRTGGRFAISTMNRCVSEKIAEYEADVPRLPSAITKVEASTDMEKTGNIWDPKSMLVDRTTGLVYRRERFKAGDELPVEMIVTDRRYYPKELQTWCEREGLEVDCVNPVALGKWDEALDSEDIKAKEILCIGSRR